MFESLWMSASREPLRGYDDNGDGVDDESAAAHKKISGSYSNVHFVQ